MHEISCFFALKRADLEARNGKKAPKVTELAHFNLSIVSVSRDACDIFVWLKRFSVATDSAETVLCHLRQSLSPYRFYAYHFTLNGRPISTISLIKPHSCFILQLMNFIISMMVEPQPVAKLFCKMKIWNEKLGRTV